MQLTNSGPALEEAIRLVWDEVLRELRQNARYDDSIFNAIVNVS